MLDHIDGFYEKTFSFSEISRLFQFASLFLLLFFLLSSTIISFSLVPNRQMSDAAAWASVALFAKSSPLTFLRFVTVLFLLLRFLKSCNDNLI